MIEKARNILKKKHLLIIGESEVERKKFISDLITVVNFEVFRFPSKMKLFNEYYNFIKKENFINLGTKLIPTT